MNNDSVVRALKAREVLDDSISRTFRAQRAAFGIGDADTWSHMSDAVVDGIMELLEREGVFK